MRLNCNHDLKFQGITAIRAVSDSHQETRKEAQLISRVIKQSKTKDNILFLNCGDLFCGVYPRESMIDTYLKFKELAPNVEIVATIGNNDSISQKDKYFNSNKALQYNSIDFLKKTIEKFESKGINVVCSNIVDKTTNNYPGWIKPYSIVERDGDRIFISGFCIDRLDNKALNINVLSNSEAINKLQQYIELEKPDSVIILNHDYLDSSVNIHSLFHPDLIIGGHDHNRIPMDKKRRIFYPGSFSSSMFEIDLKIKDNVSKILSLNEIKTENVKILPELDKLVSYYEKDCKLNEVIAQSTLDLAKLYAHPCALGGFLADGIKDKTESDIAFFASNIIRVPLRYKENGNIKNYDLRKVITFDSTIQKAELNTDALKEVFNSALRNRVLLGEQNSTFLQFSTNVGVEVDIDKINKTCTLKQIYINNTPLLDDNQNPIYPDKKFICAFDNFIPNDNRSKLLQEAKKEDFKDENYNNYRFDKLLFELLQEAPKKYEKGMVYPSFKLIEKNIEQKAVL